MNDERRRQLSWLIGVPLLVLILALWQFHRTPSAGEIEEQIGAFKTLIGRLDKMIAQAGDSRASLTIDIGKRRVQAGLARSRLEDAARYLGTVVAQRKLLALAAIASSLLALMWAGMWLAGQRHLRAQAVLSCDLLLASFLRSKRLLVVSMVVTVMLLFAAALASVLYELLTAWHHPFWSSDNVGTIGGVLSVTVAVGYFSVRVFFNVTRMIRHPFVSEPLQVIGQVVPRAQAPALWSLVGDVAQRIDASMPDAIVVGLDHCFFITDHTVCLYSGIALPRGRVLYLPLPYLAFLERAEVAAVIAHELAHFTDEDTVYSKRFTPAFAAAIRNFSPVMATGHPLSPFTMPAAVLAEMFLNDFHSAAQVWSRKRELSADAAGARAAGTDATAAALLRTAALHPLVAEVIAAHWNSAQPIAGGVLGHLRQLVASKGMVNPEKQMLELQSHPFDTHPSLAERIKALGVEVNAQLSHRAVDPSPSPLLEELGLDDDSNAATTDTAAAASPSATINTQLQSELTTAAAVNREETINALSTIVRQAQTPRELCERPQPETLLHLFWVVTCSPFGILKIKHAENFSDLLVGLGLTTLGVAILAFILRHFLWRRRPALVLRPDGLQFFDQPALPWTAIDDVSATQDTSLVINLQLAEHAPAPQLPLSSRYEYHKMRHQLRIRLKGWRGRHTRRAIEAIAVYWRAASARAELERMGEAVR